MAYTDPISVVDESDGLKKRIINKDSYAIYHKRNLKFLRWVRKGWVKDD